MEKTQEGFSTLEILIILVIVSLIGLVGWFVYDQQNNNSSPIQAGSKTQISQATQGDSSSSASKQEYLTVTEWAIKIPINNKVKGLSYKLSKNVASFRSTALNDVSGSCESNSINVARGKADEIVPNELGSDEGSSFINTYNNTTIDKANLTARSIKAKINNYFFVVPSFAGGSCANSSDAEKETAGMLDIVEAFNLVVAQN